MPVFVQGHNWRRCTTYGWSGRTYWTSVSTGGTAAVGRSWGGYRRRFRSTPRHSVAWCCWSTTGSTPTVASREVRGQTLRVCVCSEERCICSHVYIVHSSCCGAFVISWHLRIVFSPISVWLSLIVCAFSVKITPAPNVLCKDQMLCSPLSPHSSSLSPHCRGCTVLGVQYEDNLELSV